MRIRENILSKIRLTYIKYFSYDDKLQRVVSKATGLLIVAYNFLAGVLIVDITVRYGIGFNPSPILSIAIYPLPSMIAAILLIMTFDKILSIISRGTVIEEYSYLRLILLSTLVFYFILILFFAILRLIKMLHSLPIPDSAAISKIL